MDGGKIYDKGSYGCIFVPPLKCKNKKILPINKTVKGILIDKLMTTSEAEFEYAIGTRVRKLPLWQNYYLVSESICDPAPLSEQTDRNISKCDIIDTNDLDKLSILRMHYGGIPLSMYRINPEKHDFIQFTKHLLEGVSLLNLFEIVHRDLHKGNILIDQNDVPRIIDFNISVDLKKNITSSNIRHAYTLLAFQEPPDSTLVNAIALGKSPYSVIKQIIYNKRIIKDIQAFLGKSLDEMYRDLEEFYEKSRSLQEGNDVAWFKTYWRVIDSWAVGVNLINEMMKLLLLPSYRSKIDTYLSVLKPIVSRMCEIDPTKRIDCIQALYMLDPGNYIIKKYGQVWLETLGNIKK